MHILNLEDRSAITFTWELASWVIGVVWLVSCALLTWVDIKTQTLPNRIIGWGSLATLIVSVVAAAVTGEWVRVLSALALSLAVGVLFLLVALIARGSFGMGDVKFAPLCYWPLSLLGVEALFFGVMFSFVLAAVGGLIVMAFTRSGLKRKIPLGPFMALSTVVVLIVWFLLAFWM